MTRAGAPLLFLLLAACAMPPAGLWPAKPGEPATRIVVSSDAWHSMIALPSAEGGFEEWGYAEKAWYLEGTQGAWGVLRALLWPSEGIVEVARVERPFALRSRQGEPKVWELDLGARSLARLRAYLESSRLSPVPVVDQGWRRWYATGWDYHFFHTCHHYVANALFEAGIPVFARHCWLPCGLWTQLDRLR